MLVMTWCFPDGTWVAVAPGGFFEASSEKDGMEHIAVTRGKETCPTDQSTNARVYNILHRPDLIREKMAGDPDGKVKAAAESAQIDLAKICFAPDNKQNQQRQTDTGQRP
jgi:hypothetical protein